nr:TnpV protein [Desulfosporosinus sp. BICA1-9]
MSNTQNGDYHISSLVSQKQECEIGIFGREHLLQYLKESQPMIYTEFLFSGRLNAYLHEVDIKALEMYDRLAGEYSLQQGVTEQLKAKNQMEWVGRMNNIQNAVEEVIRNEIIS